MTKSRKRGRSAAVPATWGDRARMFQMLVAGATVVFAVSFFLTRRFSLVAFDVPVTRWIQHWHTGWLDSAMDCVSHVGYPPWAPAIVVVAMVVVLLAGLRWEAVVLLLAGAGIGVINKLGKKFVEIPRPTADMVRLVTPITDFSFPSGHVLLLMAFGGFGLFLVYTWVKRPWVRWGGLALFGVAGSVVGISRVYMGHHWPSDVLGAYALGSLLLSVTIFVYRRVPLREKLNSPRWRDRIAGIGSRHW